MAVAIQGRGPMVSSTPGVSLGLIWTKPGSYYPASRVSQSDTGSQNTLPSSLRAGTPGAPDPWEKHILAVAAFDLPAPPTPRRSFHPS